MFPKVPVKIQVAVLQNTAGRVGQVSLVYPFE